MNKYLYFQLFNVYGRFEIWCMQNKILQQIHLFTSCKKMDKKTI